MHQWGFDIDVTVAQNKIKKVTTKNKYLPFSETLQDGLPTEKTVRDILAADYKSPKEIIRLGMEAIRDAKSTHR